LEEGKELSDLVDWGRYEGGVLCHLPKARPNMAVKKEEAQSEVQGQQPSGVGAPETKKITKLEAVRRALNTLGNDAKPIAIQEWVFNEFNIRMTTDHISTSKGDILRKAAGKKPASRRSTSRKPRRVAPTQEAAPEPAAPPAPPAQVVVVTPPAPAVTNGLGTLRVEDVATAKALLQRLGADQLRALLDILAR
jgi:hypothetical protein